MQDQPTILHRQSGKLSNALYSNALDWMHFLVRQPNYASSYTKDTHTGKSSKGSKIEVKACMK
jgi:hypothetical protein